MYMSWKSECSTNLENQNLKKNNFHNIVYVSAYVFIYLSVFLMSRSRRKWVVDRDIFTHLYQNIIN